MKRYALKCAVFLVFSSVLSSQMILTETYTTGIINSSYDVFDPVCNGPVTILEFTLPPGENIRVDSVTIMYEYFATTGFYHQDQRSAIYCQNTGVQEPTYAGIGMTDNAPFQYVRTGVDIANGVYAGGDKIQFEMRAWRTAGPLFCGGAQHISNGTWTMELWHSPPFDTPKVGIATETPQASLDVNGKIRIGDDNEDVIEGNIRYNKGTKNFEGYNGTDWIVLNNPEISAPTPPFDGSTLLDEEFQRQLSAWSGYDTAEWEICYRKSTDGTTSATFHSQCDLRGPSVTVIQLSNGRVFGGFNSSTWTDIGEYRDGTINFLFSVDNASKYPLVGTNVGTYNGVNYGPTFGGGHDIYVNSSMELGYLYFPYSYARIGVAITPSDAACQELAGINHSTSATITELEVWILK